MAEEMSVYESDPDAMPDSEFEPGSLHHLVVGNTGRLLDARRTPVTIVDLRTDTGFVLLRLDDFEDTGATWEVPFEGVDHYQFARGHARAADAAVDEFQRAIDRFDRPLVIEADRDDRRATEERIADQLAEVEDWLGAHSRFLAARRSLPDPETRHGDVLLAADLESFMRHRGLWEIEAAFARQFVSNPSSGEIVKGHAIVLAECGLAAYAGTIIRDPATFEGQWSRERRVAHVCARLGFLRALLARLGHDRVTLWRGLSTETSLEPDRLRTFVSTSFSEAVARSHFESGSEQSTRLLIRQAVPVTRLFMTYLETSVMDEHYLEAEAVLLAKPGDGVGLGC